MAQLYTQVIYDHVV